MYVPQKKSCAKLKNSTVENIFDYRKKLLLLIGNWMRNSAIALLESLPIDIVILCSCLPVIYKIYVNGQFNF